jgi:predicted Holliday junction resolvase-like endonuclease
MKNEAIIVVVALVIFFVLIIYSSFQMFLNIPTKNAEIELLKYKLKVADKALDETVQDEIQCRTALNFEKLFLLVAKPDSITLLGDLEKQIEDKAEFCLGEVEP